MEPLLTNQVTWTQTNLQPIYSGSSLISSRQLYVTEKANVRLESKNKNKFFGLPLDIKQIEENYTVSAAFLINARHLAPLKVTSFGGKNTYKIITFFTDEILNDNRLYEIEVNALKIQLISMKRIVFLLRENQTGKIQHIAVHKDKSFLRLFGKIHGVGLAKFNKTGQWVKKSTTSNNSKKIPNDFKIELLKDAKLLPIADNLYSKLKEKSEEIFTMKIPKNNFPILNLKYPSDEEKSENYF